MSKLFHNELNYCIQKADFVITKPLTWRGPSWRLFLFPQWITCSAVSSHVSQWTVTPVACAGETADSTILAGLQSQTQVDLHLTVFACVAGWTHTSITHSCSSQTRATIGTRVPVTHVRLPTVQYIQSFMGIFGQIHSHHVYLQL